MLNLVRLKFAILGRYSFFLPPFAFEDSPRLLSLFTHIDIFELWFSRPKTGARHFYQIFRFLLKF